MAVRRESVVLSLEDHFTAGALRAAAATELLDKKLDGLGNRSVQTSRAQRDMESSVMGATRASDAGGKSIDRYSGRLGLLVSLASTLGPSLVPIAAVGIPAVTGLASALGIAALGAGTAVFAFQGVGDALEKVNKARLAPTATNLNAAREALDKLGPSARDLVAHLANLGDQVKELRNAASGGLMPGVNEALDDLIKRVPEVEKILHRVGHAVGEMLADGAESLASDKWDDFFDFIKTEAPPALADMGRAIGNLTHAAAELWMAFGPLNGDALDWLVTGTENIDRWAEGLSKTEGFKEFVAYIRENGPRVGDTLAAIAMALLDIVEAAAPVGAATLPILEAVAKALSAIADSDLGTPILAILAISRAVSLLNGGLTAINASWAGNIRGVIAFTSGVEKAGTAFIALSAAGLILDAIHDKAVGAAPAVEKLTASLIAANNEQFAAEFGSDLKSALDDLDPSGIDGVADSLNNLADKGGIAGRAVESGLATIIGQGARIEDVRTETDKAGQAFESLDTALAGLVASGGPERAQQAFVALAASQHLTADEQKSLMALLPGYSSALQGAANAAALAAEADGTLTTARDFLFGSTTDVAGAERDHAGAADQTRGALEGLTAVTDTNKDGVIDNTDAILDNIAAMEDRTDAINAAFDAETNYQRSLQIGADREKAAADIREQIADAQAQGAKDRAELQQRLAGAKTPAERKSIQGQINDSLKSQADTIERLREQLAEYAPTLDKTTKAGQANRDVLSQMAAGWNNLSGEQQNAKGKYEEARKAIIDQAKQFGATGKQAKWYADKLLDIPPKVSTKILLEKQRAQEALDAFSEAFNGLDGKTVKTFIDLRIDTIEGKLENGGKTPTAPGKPGKPGKDGRVVIPRQRLTARDVTRGSHTITSHGASADDIAAAVSRHARPMFDNVQFNSQGDFDRAMQLASSLANKGGA